MFENIKYYILGVNDKDNINFSETIHKSFDAMRKSLDGKKCIIKIDGSPKEFLNNINSLEGPYNHNEIRSIVESQEWTK